MASEGNSSRLALMQVKYQQRQLQEREKKLEMITTKPMTNHESNEAAKLASSLGAGKVRQMFDERRQRSTGIDKSYPLQPITPKITSSTSATGTTTTTTTKSGRTVVNTVRRTVGVRQTNNGPAVTNIRSETISYSSDLATNNNNNRLNGNSELLNKLNTDDNYNIDTVDYYEDSLDDEKFPDTSINFDEDILNLTTRLPNVGKLTLNNSNNNNNKEMINNNNNNNSNNNVVKLKPVIIRKSSVGEPIKSTLNGNKRVQPVKNHTAPPAIKSTTINQGERSPEKSMSPTTPPIAKSRAVKTPPTQRPKPIGSSPVKSNTEIKKTVATKSMTSRPPSGPRPDNTTPCKICGRYFNSDRVEKHETICAKSKKKRKVFDVTKHRIEGTEAEQFVKKAIKSNKVKKEESTATTKKSDWRRKHEEFIAAIRAAKEVQQHLARGGKLSDLPPPPPSENPDYVQCPHCSRRFNETAASRHIPKCATMLHNKPKAAVVQKKRY